MTGAPQNAFVLVIEDDDAIRQSIIDALELEGFEGKGFADGNEAIRFLNRTQQEPRVILLDMMMAGMNGWQFLDYQRNHKTLSLVPVIVCSALSETARSVSPAAVLPKPIQLKSLIDAVKVHFDSAAEEI